MTAAPASHYYRVQPHADRWAVAHALPGMHGSWSVDVDCATQASAEREAQRLNAERARMLMTERHEAVLQGAW